MTESYFFQYTSSKNEGASADSEGKKEKTEIQFWNPFTADGAEKVDKLVAKFNSSQDEIFVKALSNQDSQKEVAAIFGFHARNMAESAHR